MDVVFDQAPKCNKRRNCGLLNIHYIAWSSLVQRGRVRLFLEEGWAQRTCSPRAVFPKRILIKYVDEVSSCTRGGISLVVLPICAVTQPDPEHDSTGRLASALFTPSKRYRKHSRTTSGRTSANLTWPSTRHGIRTDTSTTCRLP